MIPRPLNCLCAMALTFLACCQAGQPESPTAKTNNLPLDLGTRKVGVDWERFLGPTGNSVSSEKGLLTSWPKQGPNIVWIRPMGAGYSLPAISKGRAFLFDRVGNQARMVCCHSETGKELWEQRFATQYEDLYGYSNGPRCYPVVDQDRVYFFGPEGMLYCLKAVDGTVLWKADTFGDFGVVQNFFGVGSTPAVHEDLLLVPVGGSPKGSNQVDFTELKGNGSGIVAFDKFTGKVRYKITDELASYSSPTITTIQGKKWGFHLARSGLIGFDPGSGKVEFQFPWRSRILESVNAANPVVIDNRVFISETYGPGAALIEVQPGSGKVIWDDAGKVRDKSMQCHWNTPIHVNGYLYGCSGRHKSNAELRCIELATGKVQWSVPGMTRSSLLLADGHFICQDEEGGLHLIKVNPEKFELLSSVQLKYPAGMKREGEPLLLEPCWSAPILSHGLLYLRGRDCVACLEVIPTR